MLGAELIAEGTSELQLSEENDELEALRLVQEQEDDIAEAATAAVAPVLHSFDDAVAQVEEILGEAIAFPVHLQDMDMVGQPVEQRTGQTLGDERSLTQSCRAKQRELALSHRFAAAVRTITASRFVLPWCRIFRIIAKMFPS